MKKNLVVLIKASQEFIRSSGNYAEEYGVELNSFYESISDLYLPLLNLLGNAEANNQAIRFSLVLPPMLCTMLTDKKLHELYVEWLDKRVELGKKELIRCKDSPEKIKSINSIIEKYQNCKSDFSQKYNENLIKAFSEFQSKGYLELLATCGTDIFLPHYTDLPEVVSAQIETGLIAYRTCFGEVPDGFWLPELGYFPGVEKIIRSYGYSYTILDSKSMLLGNTLPSKGIFYPARTENSLVLFANDPELKDLFDGDSCIQNKNVYRNENQDIGFELKSDELAPVIENKGLRCSTGYKYYNRHYDSTECLYDEQAAKNQAEEDAKEFLKNKAELLTKASELIPDSDFVVSVCALDAFELAQNWHEFLFWIEGLLNSAASYDLTLTTGRHLIENQFKLEKISPYYAAFSGSGYGEDLLSSKNCWMMRYVMKSSERMVDLANRFPTDTGLKNRLLNLGAKELLLAQSVGLQKMVDEDIFPEFATERFIQSIAAFTTVFDSLGSNTVSTEWLTTLEEKDYIFPWMNYRIFIKKQ